MDSSVLGDSFIGIFRVKRPQVEASVLERKIRALGVQAREPIPRANSEPRCHGQPMNGKKQSTQTLIICFVTLLEGGRTWGRGHSSGFDLACELEKVVAQHRLHPTPAPGAVAGANLGMCRYRGGPPK